jgi:hypothetical protein
VQALVENIASKISQQDTLVAPPDDKTEFLEDGVEDSVDDSPNDRADRGSVIFAPERQNPGTRPSIHQRQPQQNRRQDAFSWFGNQAAAPPQVNRGQRKLPPPPSSANSVNSINNGQFRQQKPPVGSVPASWPNPQQGANSNNNNNNNQFGFIPAAFNSFNPFAFFQSEVEKPQQPQQAQQPQQQQQSQPQQSFVSAPNYPTKRPIQQQQQQPVQQQLQTGFNGASIRNGNNVNKNDYNAYIDSVNAIQTIPAPDLTKIGPPVIELDSKDGQIVVGQPFSHENRDHLAGFVSLDFDGFAAGGDLEDKKNKDASQVDKSKLSLIVGGNPSFNKADFESDLVNLLNSKDDDPLTYILGADKATPLGFAKLDLPYMDPTEHKGKLPKVFIAPVGKPIPKGYKGKPLPSEPQSSSSPATTETVLVVETSTQAQKQSSATAESGVDSQSTPSYAQKGANTFRFKLQKERPSLSQFYLKNKKDKFEELKKKPEKQDKFFAKNRVEELDGDERLEDSQLTNENNVSREETDKQSEEAGTETFLPPLTVLSVPADVIATTSSPSDYQSPDELTGGSVPTIQNLREAEATTAHSAAVSAGITESAGFVHEPIVQSTLEQQHQFSEEQQLQEQEKHEQLPEHVHQQQLVEQYAEQQQEQELLPEQEQQQQLIEQQHSTYQQQLTDQELQGPSASSTIPATPDLNYIVTEPVTSQAETTSPSVVLPRAQDIATSSSPTWETTQNIAEIPEEVSSTVAKATTILPNRKVLRTTQDPFARLEALRKQKQEQLEIPSSSQPYPADLATSEDEEADIDSGAGDDVTVPDTVVRQKTRLRLRKYNNGSSSSEAAVTPESGAPGPVKKFGKRIRTRKRPAFWPSRAAGGEEGGVEPTLRPGGLVRQKLTGLGGVEPTATVGQEVLKTEEYKKKFRPFFDQLYSQFNKGEDFGAEVEVETGSEALSVTDGPLAPRRLGFPRKISTTPQTPITVGKH